MVYNKYPVYNKFKMKKMIRDWNIQDIYIHNVVNNEDTHVTWYGTWG